MVLNFKSNKAKTTNLLSLESISFKFSALLSTLFFKVKRDFLQNFNKTSYLTDYESSDDVVSDSESGLSSIIQNTSQVQLQFACFINVRLPISWKVMHDFKITTGIT